MFNSLFFQELDCVCNSDYDDDEDELVFPFAPVIVVAAGGSKSNISTAIASVKLHSCRRANIRMDLRSFQRPFYRMRVEDIQTVKVEGVTLLPNDTVDIWFRNINGSLDISGDVSCDGCAVKVENGTAFVDSRPNLMLHAVDVGALTLSNLMVGDDVAAKIKVRNAKSLRVSDSYFKSVPRDGIEVFNVEGAVVMEHSEFHNTTAGSVLFNGIGSLEVRDSLLDRDAVEVMNGERAEVEWHCTVSPLVAPSEAMSPKEMANCSLPTGRTFLRGGEIGDGGGGAEASGAIVLAVVSATIFLVAVAVLGVLYRSGRLEKYL